jgi:hypothetical protein
MQTLSFYHSGFVSAFSGNADALLLPFELRFHIFGQCRRSPFTVLAPIPHFRAMQMLSFYRFGSDSAFSGNAKAIVCSLFVMSRLLHFL